MLSLYLSYITLRIMSIIKIDIVQENVDLVDVKMMLGLLK